MLYPFDARTYRRCARKWCVVMQALVYVLRYCRPKILDMTKMAEKLHARIFLNSANVRKASAASRLFTLLIFVYCIPSFLPSPRLYSVDTKWTLLRVSHSVTHYVLMSAERAQLFFPWEKLVASTPSPRAVPHRRLHFFIHLSCSFL